MKALRMGSSLWLPTTFPFTSRECQITFARLSLYLGGRKNLALINVSAIEFGESGVPFSSIASGSGIGMGKTYSSHGSQGFSVCSFAGTVNESP